MAGIYIHVPFCRKLCHYCDFYHVVSEDDNSSFIRALLKESELRQDYLGTSAVSTVYFGGGTPSVLSPGEIREILDGLNHLFSIDPGSEITMEVNPDDVNISYLEALRNMGINRISIGVQSWDDEDLKMLNRRHTGEQAMNSIDQAFAAGFENVAIDLIYGIPGMTSEKWTKNLKTAFSTGIQHLSAYHLTIEPGTFFGKMVARGDLRETNEDESSQQFNLIIEKANAAGFIHYEISNFGKPGYFSVHNSNYWKQVPYLGLGPSAHSFNGYSRQWNIRDLKKYLKYVHGNREYYKKEELDNRMRFNEYVLTSLRTMWGMDLEYVETTFNKEGYDYVINLAGKFIGYGMMKQKKNALVLTAQGMMISDNIISEFMLPPAD